MYPRYCRSKSKTFFCRPLASVVSLGILAFILFAAGLYHLRSEELKESGKEKTENSIVESTASVQLQNVSEETVIKSLLNGLEIGSATRGLDKEIFYYTAKVSLPVIDREKEFYEVWLLRQTPFDFFSIGEMVNNTDGEFVLEWAGERVDIKNYNQIVVTRQFRGGNASPGEKIAQGKFE